MSSRSYTGRHVGRHRSQQRRARVPRALSPGFVLPTSAAAALVVTATGASMAESAPQPLEFASSQTALVRSQQAADDQLASDLAARRQDASIQSAAFQGRTEAQARAARSAQRKAAAAAKAKAEAEKRAKKWVRPIHIWNITSGFGARWGTHHDGLDLAAPTGTPLYALSKGTVLKAGWEDSFGNKVAVQYWDGSVIWYGHMSRIDVQAGETVLPGEQVGLVGNTGHSFGSHLHFEVQVNGENIDPAPFMAEVGIQLGQ
ncbi:MAG: M23 family metallopeptidase [Micrococcales bacterium]|nr:M23 family metallopeptidase [Micrococcales bacterium]